MALGLPWWLSDQEFTCQKMQVGSLGQKDPLEKETATHFSILAWEIPWTEEPGGLHFKRVRHDLVTEQQQKMAFGVFKHICVFCVCVCPYTMQ